MTEDRYAAAWDAARPYLRARRNDIHIPLSFAYAERLLEHYPEADRDVVLLGIMLHDNGWAVLDEEEIARDAFGDGMWESAVRIAHEREGARIAGEILDELGYPAALRDEVVEIIAGHDSRTHALSRNDELVKDADKLWRFTVVGVALSSDWFGETPSEHVDRLQPIAEALFTQAGREMALPELERSRKALRTAQLAESTRR
jgi:hypothetical protein